MNFRLRNAEFVASMARAGASAVTPATFPIVSDGLVHQIESLDFDGQSNGTSVTSWVDKSSTPHNWSTFVSAPTVDTVNTLNGHATVAFNGSNQGMQSNLWIPATGAWTGAEMFVVTKRINPVNGTESGPTVCWNRTSDAIHHPYFSDGGFYESFCRTDRPFVGQPGSQTGQPNGSYKQQFATYNVYSSAANNQYVVSMNTSSVTPRALYGISSGYTFQLRGFEQTFPGKHTLGSVQQNDTSNLFYKGNIAAVYLFSRVLSAAERQQMFYYIDYTWNLTVQGWADRCVVNGGTRPTVAEQAAARTYWLACCAAGLPAKLKFVNLFSSAHLTSALTPFVNIWGADTIQNVNFVGGDLNASGLKGDGVNKYLIVTSFVPTTALASNLSGGLTLYSSDAGHGGTERYDCGYTSFSGDNDFILSYKDSNLSNQARFGCWANPGGEIDGTGQTSGFLSGNRISATDAKLYWASTAGNHQQLGSISTTAGARQGSPLYVYAVNAQDSGAFGHTAARFGYFAVHDGLTLAESQAHAAAVIAFRQSYL